MAPEPLGMTDSSYVWREEYERQAATWHDETAQPTEKWWPAVAVACSSLHTTQGLLSLPVCDA